MLENTEHTGSEYRFYVHYPEAEIERVIAELKASRDHRPQFEKMVASLGDILEMNLTNLYRNRA